MPRAAETATASYGPSARLNIVLPSTVRGTLESLAADEGKTLSDLAREILEQGVERRRRERIYAEVERTYPACRQRLLDLLRTYEGIDEEVRRR